MLSSYFGLIGRSLKNSVNGREYSRWYRVPAAARIKFALWAMLGVIPAFIILSLERWGTWKSAIYAVYFLFVLTPAYEHWTEKLKRRYDKVK